LEALLDGIERVRQGELSHRFAIKGDEEFRALACAFNQTYADLKTAHDSILHAEKLATTGKIAAGVAHEVLNPLTSISSIVQLMQRECDSDEQKERIRLIMKETSRISRVLHDLQTFSRPVPPQHPISIKVDELIEYSANLVGYDQRARKVAIRRHVDCESGMVRADPDRLSLVFTNIMMNAIEALSTKNGDSGVLAVEATQVGRRIRVRFSDNGPGMTEEQLARAFEPFFTTKEAGAGTGLGLWICHQVIEAHGGTIRIDSPAGEGTTVTIELPCGPGQTQA
jgi:signal transduction histidine kinase